MRMPHADPEVRRAYGREWIKRNAAKAREAMSRWRAAHREQDRASKRDYYARNRKRTKAAVVAYRLANPEVVRVVRRLRRAREVAALGAYTTTQWLDLVRLYGGCCGYCGIAATLEPRPSGSLVTRRIELDREHHPVLPLMQHAEANRD